jgi:hypothetical protein
MTDFTFPPVPDSLEARELRRRHFPMTWPEYAESDERVRIAMFNRMATLATSRRDDGRFDPESKTPNSYRAELTNDDGHVVDVRRFERLPSWTQLEIEGIAVREFMTTNETGRVAWRRMYASALSSGEQRTLGTHVAPEPESFTITNPQHFQFLPSIERMKKNSVREAVRHASLAISPAAMIASSILNPGSEPPELIDDERKERIARVVSAEQAHLLYHRAMWQHNGRRVLVLDRYTHTLLQHTPLPKIPAGIVGAPFSSFYLVLPPKSFEFEVQDVRNGKVDRRFAEGIMISIDHAEPNYPGLRELSFMVMGEIEPGFERTPSEGRNCAFATFRFAPDATIDQFEISEKGLSLNESTRLAGLHYGDNGFVGSHDLNVSVPQIIFGLLLYLLSEHPDVVPVAPPPRRDFGEIRSPGQRDAARRNQAEKMKGKTSLPVFVIGAHTQRDVERLADEERARDAARGKKWELTEAVLVRGHWRQQPYGPGRMWTRTQWIRPYWRGPDAAESLKMRAARVPKAQQTTTTRAGGT